jgi:hypothetical protein
VNRAAWCIASPRACATSYAATAARAKKASVLDNILDNTQQISASDLPLVLYFKGITGICGGGHFKPAPQAGASASSATSAFRGTNEMCRPNRLVRLTVMTRSTVAGFGVSDFTTLRNRLAKCLQPSIWQTLESDKRRQEPKARPTNETVCIVDSRGDRRVGSARGARHPHRPD